MQHAAKDDKSPTVMPRVVPPDVIVADPIPLGWVTAVTADDGTITYNSRTQSYPLVVAPFLPDAKNIDTVLGSDKNVLKVPDNSLEIFES